MNEKMLDSAIMQIVNIHKQAELTKKKQSIWQFHCL